MLNVISQPPGPVASSAIHYGIWFAIALGCFWGVIILQVVMRKK